MVSLTSALPNIFIFLTFQEEEEEVEEVDKEEREQGFQAEDAFLRISSRLRQGRALTKRFFFSLILTPGGREGTKFLRARFLKNILR